MLKFIIGCFSFPFLVGFFIPLSFLRLFPLNITISDLLVTSYILFNSYFYNSGKVRSVLFPKNYGFFVFLYIFSSLTVLFTTSEVLSSIGYIFQLFLILFTQVPVVSCFLSQRKSKILFTSGVLFSVIFTVATCFYCYLSGNFLLVGGVRFTGPYLSPNPLAFQLAVTLPIALFAIKNLEIKSIFKLVFTALVGLPSILILAFTGSRTVILAYSLVMIIVFIRDVFSFFKALRIGKRILLALSSVSISIIFVLAYKLDFGFLNAPIRDFGFQTQRLTTLKLTLNEISLLDAIFGSGIESKDLLLFDKVHNVFFLTLIESGLFSFFAFIFLFCFLAWCVFSAIHNSLLSGSKSDLEFAYLSFFILVITFLIFFFNAAFFYRYLWLFASFALSSKQVLSCLNKPDM